MLHQLAPRRRLAPPDTGSLPAPGSQLPGIGRAHAAPQLQLSPEDLSYSPSSGDLSEQVFRKGGKPHAALDPIRLAPPNPSSSLRAWAHS